MKSFAIAVTFPNPIEPFSDEEGWIPSHVEDAGLDRKGVLVSPDRRTIYTTIRNNTVTPDALENIEGRIVQEVEEVSTVVVEEDDLCFSAAMAVENQDE